MRVGRGTVTKRQLSVTLILLGFVVTAYGIIDLTPTPTEYRAEGVTFQQLLFKDDRQIISYDLPRQWTYRFEGGRIVLAPPQTPFAEAVIEAVPLAKPQPLDESTIKVLEQQIVGALPASSDSVAVLKREQNPVILDSNRSFELVLSYNALGTSFQRSVLFIDTSTTRLVFKLTSRRSDFDKLNSIFRASILTWQRLEPIANAKP